MGLDDGWSYDKDRKVLSKTFKFKRHFKPGDEPLSSAVIPGKPAGQVVGPGSCFTFAQHVQNLCTNGDHWIYNLTLTPRKAEAHVELKTIIRGGLTSSDFYMAMHLDALMHTTFPRKD
jgi:pterin-4a-carbinolamine dehydratase